MGGHWFTTLPLYRWPTGVQLFPDRVHYAAARDECLYEGAGDMINKFEVPPLDSPTSLSSPLTTIFK